MIVECPHYFLMDITMAHRRSSDASGRRVVKTMRQEKVQNWKEEVVGGVYFDEERIIIISMSEELGG